MKFRDKNGRVYSVDDEPVVDDEMVERAAQALNGTRPLGEENNSARRILKSALTTPTEPEMVVTEKMRDAARSVASIIAKENGFTEPSSLYLSNKNLRDIYSAMYTARPKKTKNALTEPEIEVTDEMVRAGEGAIYKSYWARQTSNWTNDAALASYRAMRRLEPKKKPRPGIGLTERRENNRRKDDA